MTALNQGGACPSEPSPRVGWGSFLLNPSIIPENLGFSELRQGVANMRA